jgi:ketosteroid isomerase-like protein
MRNRVVTATLVTLGAIVGCGSPAPAPAPAANTEADRQAIAQLRDREIALFSAGNIDDVLAVFTDDLVVMPPNEPVRAGKQEARAWLQQLYKQFKIEGTYTSSSDPTVAGDWAFERMTFRLKLTPVSGGAAIEDVGKGFHVYRRQGDGSWKIAQDIWNSDKPAGGQ